MEMTVHMSLNVRGALMNFKRHEWKGVCTDEETGRVLSVDEVYEALVSELANGRKVIPIGKVCEGFDYSGGGCPGHPKED